MDNFENKNNMPDGIDHSSVPTAAPNSGAFQGNNGPAPMPQLQLTPEQIAALLNQLVIIQPTPQPEKPAEPLQLKEGKNLNKQNDPGTRILFQSDDFEEKDNTFDPHSLSDAIEEETKSKGFYDDDRLFQRESVPNEPKSKKAFSPIKTTDFGTDFRIDEVELSKDDMPALKQKKEKEQKKTENKKPAVEIEEETLSVSKRKPPVAEEKKNVIKATALPTSSLEEFETEIPISQNEKKKKKLPLSEIIRRSILGLSALVIVISAAVLVREYKLHKDNQSLEEDISNLIVSEAQTTKKQKNDKDKNNKKDEKETTALTPEMQWAEIKEKYPNVIFPPNLQLKYAKLYATNQDFVGYLSADGIDMSLPIVQTDNDNTYMKKNFYGQTTKYGCPFVTHLNNINELDMNTVIFGHHMNDGTVFGILDKYKSIENYKKAPVISFNTIYKDYKWKIIAAFVTNAYEKDDNGYVFQYYFTSLSSEERFSAFLNELSQRSLYDTGVDVLPTDKILTLSTCSHEFTDARFVVVARLVRSGESEEVDTSLAVENPSPRYPQAYYNKKKVTNPYKNAQKWYVG